MKTLFLDIETAPNLAHVWGLFNQNIGINQIIESGYTLCWAAKWKDEKEMMFSSKAGDGSDIMVERMWEMLDEADAVVHYNGTKFDIPILNKEFLQLGLGPPSPYKQIDLLKTCRKQFRFTSNKLDYVAKFLGLGNKTQHKGHDLWKGVMDGDGKCWRIMERYNKQDVSLLIRLYKRLLPWITNHPNVNLYTEEDGCSQCGEHNVQRRGFVKTAAQTYQQYQCQSCDSWLRDSKPVGRKINLRSVK